MADHDYFTSYPYLAHLLGGWFHQDFDVVGDTLEAIMADYRQSAGPHGIAGLHADIHRLIQFHGERLDAAFVELFGTVVEFEGWGLSARQWLERIDQLLEERG